MCESLKANIIVIIIIIIYRYYITEIYLGKVISSCNQKLKDRIAVLIQTILKQKCQILHNLELINLLFTDQVQRRIMSVSGTHMTVFHVLISALH